MKFAIRIDELVMEVRFAVRQLRRAPGFAAVVVATLALGVGANSAVFALADAALLRPLPFVEPDRLVMAWERRGSGSPPCRRRRSFASGRRVRDRSRP